MLFCIWGSVDSNKESTPVQVKFNNESTRVSYDMAKNTSVPDTDFDVGAHAHRGVCRRVIVVIRACKCFLHAEMHVLRTKSLFAR